MEPRALPRFGAVLRRLRREAGLTQAQLAERAHLSQRGLQDLERGIHQAPHRDTIDRLAAALGLSGQDGVAFLATAQAQPLPPLAPVSPRAPVVPEGLTPMVGRAGELALLDRFLVGESGSDRASRVLLLAGEPGIGKTRVLQAAAQQAVLHGWCVLFGGCQRRGGEDPYAPLLAALVHHIGLQPPERRASDLAGCAWLVRLLPELAEVLAPLPAAILAPEQERRLMHAAVARFLANVAGPTGTLLILDDLQWSGPDALDLIDTLARGPAPGPALRIMGAYRDTEVRAADPLGLLLADLAQARLVSRQQLGPLAAADAATLLEDLLVDVAEADHSLVDGVLRRAGGTPFFLVSYAQALRQGGADDVPWDLAQGVRQRAAVLPEIARLVLGAAAVVGRRASRDVLVAVVGQPEEAVLAGLEAACGARLLLEEGDDAYSFAHDLIREVLEADLGAARRAALHRRVAESLEQEPDVVPPELLAYHYARCGTQNKAALYLELAGDRAAAQCANRAAEDHYREALEGQGRLRRADDVARVREKLGLVLYRIGKYKAALAQLEAAATTYRATGEREGLVRVTAWIGWAYSWVGTSRESIAPLRALVQRLDQQDASPPLGALYVALGRVLYTAGQYEEALVACERAIDLAPLAGDEQTRVLAEWLRMCLLILLGQLRAALQAGQEALPRTELLDDWLCLTQAHRYLAELHILRGTLETGQEHAARAVASAGDLGDTAQLSMGMCHQAWIALLAGEWRAAREVLEQALALSGQLDGRLPTTYILLLLADLSLAEGDWATAATAGGKATALAGVAGDLQALRWASTTMAEIEILEGRPEEARERLLPLLDRPGLVEGDVTMLLPVLAWAQLELGRVNEATATVEQAFRRARPEDMRLVLVEALRVHTLIALHRGQREEAASSLEEGLELARLMPYPYAEARLLHLAGALHAEQGVPAVARERWEEALAIFTRLGARADEARTKRALHMLPGTPLAAAAEHREMTVMLMNQEIAP